jgi:hypothetical protein
MLRPAPAKFLSATTLVDGLYRPSGRTGEDTPSTILSSEPTGSSTEIRPCASADIDRPTDPATQGADNELTTTSSGSPTLAASSPASKSFVPRTLHLDPGYGRRLADDRQKTLDKQTAGWLTTGPCTDKGPRTGPPHRRHRWNPQRRCRDPIGGMRAKATAAKGSGADAPLYVAMQAPILAGFAADAMRVVPVATLSEANRGTIPRVRTQTGPAAEPSEQLNTQIRG